MSSVDLLFSFTRQTSPCRTRSDSTFPRTGEQPHLVLPCVELPACLLTITFFNTCLIMITHSLLHLSALFLLSSSLVSAQFVRRSRSSRVDLNKRATTLTGQYETLALSTDYLVRHCFPSFSLVLLLSRSRRFEHRRCACDETRAHSTDSSFRPRSFRKTCGARTPVQVVKLQLLVRSPETLSRGRESTSRLFNGFARNAEFSLRSTERLTLGQADPTTSRVTPTLLVHPVRLAICDRVLLSRLLTLCEGLGSQLSSVSAIPSSWSWTYGSTASNGLRANVVSALL